MTHNTQDWRKEFKKEFTSNGYLCTEDGDVYESKDVIVYISNLLTSQLNSLIGELEGEKIKDVDFEHYDDFKNAETYGEAVGYNQGISDAQTIIRGKMEKK